MSEIIQCAYLSIKSDGSEAPGGIVCILVSIPVPHFICSSPSPASASPASSSSPRRHTHLAFPLVLLVALSHQQQLLGDSLSQTRLLSTR